MTSQIPFSARLDPRPDAPLFAQVAALIEHEIVSGRLRAGDLLPGARSLASQLGVSRDTTRAAYSDLAAQGWLRLLPRVGAVVAQDGEPRAQSGRARSATLGFDVDEGPEHITPPPRAPKTIALYGGVPDPREIPTDLIARAFRRALKRHGRAVLSYSPDPRGHERLRKALAELVRRARGVAASPDEIIVTRGSQMAIDLVLRAIVRPGDVACVEELGYRPAWAALARAGAELVGLPLDDRGVDPSALEKRRDVRLVYVTPHHQYPTTTVLAAKRRARLLEWATRTRAAIIEDDYDYEFHYEGAPVLPLASNDAGGVVVYVGTLSKILAPGLRLGFAIAPAPLIDRLARERYLVDRQGDLALELAVAELIEDDELGRHARKMRRLYRERRDVLAGALRDALGTALTLDVPSGGLALWAKVDPSIDVARWCERAAERGVLFQPGSAFTLRPRSISAARFGYATCTPPELEEAARRLALSLRDAQRRAR